MSEIRQFARADVSAVAALFLKTFRKSGEKPGKALEVYLADAYLEHPWGDPEIAARVHVNDAGRITGFVGVFPGKFTYRGRTLRAAIAGTLMVEHPDREPLAGARLLRSVVKGPQDISISETTNLISQALWEPLGGHVVTSMSLDWFRILKPGSAAVSMLVEKHPAARALAPVALLGDAIAGRWIGRNLEPSAPSKRLSVDAAPSDADFAEAVFQLAQHVSFRPDWNTADIGWLLAHAARKQRYGPVHRSILRDAKNAIVGCYIYHGRRGGTGRVLQALAGAGGAANVVDCLFREAHEAGLAALRGRVTPQLADALLTRKCVFLHRASTVIHAADQELTAAAMGDALITGLAGESWTRLVGGTFG